MILHCDACFISTFSVLLFVDDVYFSLLRFIVVGVLIVYIGYLCYCCCGYDNDIILALHQACGVTMCMVGSCMDPLMEAVYAMINQGWGRV